ncbi:MAG: ATPase [Elusimicrobia bacterium RIFOXYD2_FULL_34_30]|nr:MAG: ATPase [Elusimicrobia bacterium RIFOXYD2_FULL_34_30]
METIIPRIFTPQKYNFFLFGPRGTGKTTYLKQNYPDAMWIDLLEADIFRSYSAYPERLRETVLANPDKKTVIIDEIQKVPELLSVIHSLIENKIKKQFILTGSSPRKLKKTGADLLAGRVIKKMMYPFMAVELGKKFNLDNSLNQGLLPLVVSAIDPTSVLKTYASLYVREEVQAEGLVRNIGNFSRFLEAVSFSHGSVLNITNVARDCEVERKVVEGYITILEDLLLAFRIPVFTKRAKRYVVAHPKFYFFDAGVYRSLRPAGPLDKSEEIGGCALEGLIAQHLIAWDSYSGDKNRIYFWRTVAGSEVDFIVYGEDVFWAIEVKNTLKIRPEDLRALKSFKEDYPESTAYFLYRGRERLMKNGILCIPCDEFLLELQPNRTKIF